jgi:hypothetical protein
MINFSPTHTEILKYFYKKNKQQAITDIIKSESPIPACVDTKPSSASNMMEVNA